ncbi:MAG: AbgT family transporter [Prevotella sp.]|nr:AbgT family transporter [Prevotella sp.]
MKIRLYSRIALLLLVLQLLVVLGSWIISATIPETNMHSLISSEGLRWYSSNFVDMMASPLLIWIMLLSMAYGCMRGSGLLSVFARGYRMTYRERTAFVFMLFVAVAYIIALLSVTVMPRAILLSASGNLWPSPFSVALVPILTVGICLFSIVYGIVAGSFHSVSDVFTSLSSGLAKSTPLVLLYMLAIQLYYSVCFVFPEFAN